MGSKFDYETKFDKAAQRAQRRNDEIVRKFRHKKQNVFKRGDMFRVDLVGFYYKNRAGTFSRFWKTTGKVLVFALKDSNQFLTHTEQNVGLGFYHLVPPYHMWPFLYRSEIVWFAVQNSFDPMIDLRGSFSRSFKIVK